MTAPHALELETGHADHQASPSTPREPTTPAALEPTPPARRKHRPTPPAERRRKARRVFARMARGDTTAEACGAEGLSYRRLWDWIDADPTLEAGYLRARTIQAAAMAERAVLVASRPARSMPAAASQRTYVDTLKWAASKLDPSRWGDRLQVERHDTKTVHHVVHLPAREGPPPAIVGGPVAVIGPVDRGASRASLPAVTGAVTDPGDDAHPADPGDDA